MKKIFVGIGEVGISNEPGAMIHTVLGSCVGLIFLAPKIRTMGIAHVALPESELPNHQSSYKKLPGYFADTAVTYMIEEFKKRGVQRPTDLIVKLTGGAAILDENGQFNIGKRNILAVRKQLWKNRLVPAKEEVAKDFSRRVRLELNTGKVYVSTPGKDEWTL